MRNVKKLLGVFVVIVCALLLVPNNVDAADIDSAETLAEVFKDKNATVNGKTVKLTGDVTIDDLIEFIDEDFVLDLNGYTLKVEEIYVISGSLTINDGTKKGVIDSKVLQVGDYSEDNSASKASLVVNQMILEASGTNEWGENKADLALEKAATVIINNAIIENGIWNNGGELTIKNAKAAFISPAGPTTIYDGEYGNINIMSLEDNQTTIYGGTFNDTGEGLGSVIIQTTGKINSNTIQKIVGKGSIAIYSGYSSCGSEEYEGVIYSTSLWEKVSVIKDISAEIFDKVAPNGVWNTNTLAPTNVDDSEFLLSAIADDFDLPKGYQIMANISPAESFDASKVVLYLYYNGSYVTSKTVKATYTKPDKETLNAVNKIIAEIRKVHNNTFDTKTSFRLDDLYLINYLNASSKGIKESMALNFAKDLIELTNGSNVVYKLDSRLGEYNPIGLWDYKGGQVIVYYNGKAVNTTMIGITVSKVLYIPMDTADTDEARINAAMKRIKEYLGTTNGISIRVGGTLESLNVVDMKWNEYDLFDETTSGDNYYIVTINGKEYKFVICKKEDLEIPKYIASDVMSSILVTSDDSSIPLDAALTVKEVKNDTIEKVLGTNVYAAYDISLYSNAKQVSIVKLENSKFIVNIPVPEILKDKEITVYYINSKGEKEEHVATIKDGIASFETDHFSTYVLAEKVAEENPKTFDGIESSIIIGTISLIGVIGTTLYFKKRNKERV